MVQLQNVLWLTDFSEDAAHALPYAHDLAEFYKTKLYLMHVIENATHSVYGEVKGDYFAMEVNAREKARTWLQEHVKRDLQGFPNHEILIREGDVLPRVVEVVTEKQIGALVMGTHGRTGLAHMLLGEEAEKVIRNVHCPVFVIPHPERVGARKAASRLLGMFKVAPDEITSRR
jgi:universal stress protein A